MPLFSYGPYQFTFSGATSGYAPTKVQGPGRSMYVIEHQIPAREGGIVEYLGSEQSKYTWKGFFSPPQDGPYNGTAGYLLSGTQYIPQNADQAMNAVFQLRGSGANLLYIESTYSNESGYMRSYENGFFVLEKATFAFEAGHTYPYYPYTIDFRGISPTMYGNSSGSASFAPTDKYYSGYVFVWSVSRNGPTSGATTNGEVINTLGIFVNAVASGNAKVAIYSGADFPSAVLTAQSAAQPVHSGWNYFPLRPSFQSTSGATVIYAFAGDATNSSGFIVAQTDYGTITTSVAISGTGFGFPSSLPGTIGSTSGNNIDIVTVTA